MKTPKKDTIEWHQLQIAKKTLKMNDIMITIMGGMTRKEAEKIIEKYQAE